jgi:hypothetical protein
MELLLFHNHVLPPAHWSNCASELTDSHHEIIRWIAGATPEPTSCCRPTTAAAKARLMWHAAPRLMRRLHSWGLLYPLTAALKAAGSQVRSACM